MSESRLRLKNPPIIESIIEIDCVLPSESDLTERGEAFKKRVGSLYPKMQRHVTREHTVVHKGEFDAELSTSQNLRAIQFATEDGKQVVQLRSGGYAFNRLAPYTTLDDYLPEIERTWKIYVDVARPIRIINVRIRNINRIPVLLRDGEWPLDEYFALSPVVAEDEDLQLSGFLRQQTAVERKTGNQLAIILTDQPGFGTDREMSVLFDITVARPVYILPASPMLPEEWGKILGAIDSLRDLKDRVFRKTLTENCLCQFQ